MLEQSGFMRNARRLIVCPRCEAKQGEPCVTLGGNPAGETHASRWQPLADHYAAGYRDGLAAKR